MFTLLKFILDEGIKPVMVEKMIILENIFALKMEILLAQRMMSMVNTQWSHMDRVYHYLQQEIRRLQS